MAATLKSKTEKAAKIATWQVDTRKNIIAYLDTLTKAMETGNTAQVISLCNSRTRKMDVQDLIARTLTDTESRDLLSNAHHMISGKNVRVANSVAELLQNLRQTTRTNCRYSTFAGPLAQVKAAKKMVADFGKETGKVTGISTKLG